MALREYGPYPDGCLKLPPIAQAFADMTMTEYAYFIVRGVVPPALAAAAEEETRVAVPRRQHHPAETS